MIHYPRIDILFCTKCRWNLRAAWYLQELLSTFGSDLGEVAMAPADSGVFQVYLQANADSPEILLWDRKQRGGFPDSKDLKQLVRDVIDPAKDLGHSDRKLQLNSQTEQVSNASAPSGSVKEMPSRDNGEDYKTGSNHHGDKKDALPTAIERKGDLPEECTECNAI